MTDKERRRRLRLGALLYQLRYFAVADQREEAGPCTVYRSAEHRAVEVTGSTVRLLAGTDVEVLDLEDAIMRCKEALHGHPLHRTLSDGV